MQFGWQFKSFKTKEKMQDWLDKNKNKIQYEEIFIDNGFAVEYRKLKIINLK